MDEKHGIALLVQKINEGKAMNPLDETDVAIIRGMTAHGMSITKTAIATHLSRKTVYNRIDRIKEKTGCDPLDFFGLYKLLVFTMKTERKKRNENESNA